MEKTALTNNNIPIYYYPNLNVHSFCISLYVKAGSMYEGDDMNGSTHLWEHMIFRHLNQVHKGLLYKKLDELGLTLHGCSYKEFIYLYISGASINFLKAAKIISSIFEPINISTTEFKLEKDRIKAEMLESTEKDSVEFFAQKIIWENTSLANSIIGKSSVINKMSKIGLQKLHKQILSENNLFFYVTGNFNDADIDVFKGFLEKYQLSSGFLNENLAPVPNNFFNRTCEVYVKNSKWDYVHFSFDIDITKYTYAEIDLIYNILFSGHSSLIFKALSEDSGIIYDLDARIERYNNLGIICFTFEINPSYITLAIEKVIDVLKKVKIDIDDALKRVIPVYTTNAEIELDDLFSINWSMAYECHIMTNTYKSVQERKLAYEGVTPKRIVEIANEIFKGSNMVLALRTNKKKVDYEKIRLIISAL